MATKRPLVRPWHHERNPYGALRPGMKIDPDSFEYLRTKARLAGPLTGRARAAGFDSDHKLEFPVGSPTDTDFVHQYYVAPYRNGVRLMQTIVTKRLRGGVSTNKPGFDFIISPDGMVKRRP